MRGFLTSQIGKDECPTLEVFRDHLAGALSHAAPALAEVPADIEQLKNLETNHELTRVLMQYSRLSEVAFVVSDAWYSQQDVPYVLALDHTGFFIACMSVDGGRYMHSTHPLSSLEERGIGIAGVVDRIYGFAEKILAGKAISVSEIGDLVQNNNIVKGIMEQLRASGEKVYASDAWQPNDVVQLRLVLGENGFEFEVRVLQAEDGHHERSQTWLTTYQPLSQHDLLLCRVSTDTIMKNLLYSPAARRAA